MTHPSPTTTATERRLWPVPDTTTNHRKEPSGPTLPPHNWAPAPATSVTDAAVADPNSAVAEGEGGGGRDTEPPTPLGYSDSDQAAELEAMAARARADVARLRLWLPPAGTDVFDCYLGRLAVELDPYTEADPIGVMASLLSMVGVHLGQGPHLQVSYERHPLVIWPILIGATNTGKKGTAHNAAKGLLMHADNDFLASNVHTGLSSGEGLASVFAETTEPSGKGGKPRLLPDGDCRLVAYEPEWGAVMERMKREGNTLSALLRAAWEGGNLSTLNVDARVARHAHVGILAHITPKEFCAKVSASDMAGGTYNRFLPIAVSGSKLLPNPPIPDERLMLDLGTGLARRLNHAGEFHAVGFTDAGTVAWQRLYYEFGTGHTDNDPAEEFISRAAPHCLRIAAIYALLDGTDRITPGHLAAAAALVRYSIASARAVLRPESTDTELVAFIAQTGQEGRTRKDITTVHFRGNAARQGINVGAVLARLTESGRILLTRRPPAHGKGGTTTEVYTVPDRR